ncbi:hypothetical protein AB0I27_22430 [Streptomyces sp. NPDC050597]|uniref:hypothetical protein n=1 Tax=Streptomyces sp. NPDC050597 TaxID=3157212 RepID=UPI00342FCA3C
MATDANPEVSWEEIGFLFAGLAAMGASILVLWLGTRPWTDYLFIALFSLAMTLYFMAGKTWVDRQFAEK